MTRAVLLTRLEEENASLQQDLAGVPCLSWPVIRIEYRRTPLPAAGAVVFTSRHGVRGWITNKGCTSPTAWCVGPATAEAARKAGFNDIHEGGGTAVQLLDRVLEARPDSLLYARGAEISHDLATELAAAGISVEECILYSAQPAGPPTPEILRALERMEIGLATAWSPRGAGLLADHLPRDLPILAISENAAQVLRKAGFQAVSVSPKPNRESMLAEIRKSLG